MVSSTPALPAVPSDPGNYDSLPAVSSEIGRENENAPSFAAQLDQSRSRTEADNAARRSQARRSEARSGPQSLKPDSEAPNTVTSSAADSAPEPGDTETVGDDSDSSNTRKDQKSRVDTATPADSAAAPLPTINALSLSVTAASQAVAPTPVLVQTAAYAVSANLVLAAQTGNSSAALTGNSSIAAQGVNADTASIVPNAAQASPSLPTAAPIIPTVAMDSRAAVLNAAPGVDNATPLPVHLLAASTANSTLEANRAKSEPTLPNITRAALPNDSLTLNGAVAAAIDSATAPKNNSAVKVVSNNLSEAEKATVVLPMTAGLPPSSGAATASLVSIASTTAANGIVEAQGIDLADASNAQSKTQTSVALEQVKPSALLTGKQNLEGIERLLTLSNAKSAPIAAEAVTQTAAPNVHSLLNSASGASTARLGSTGNLIGTRQESLAGVYGAQTGMSALTNGTEETQAATPTALAASSLDSFGKAGAVAQGLHGASGAAELTHALSAPPLSSTGNGKVGDGVPFALAQATMPANGDAGESEQSDSQSSSSEQSETSENGVANTSGSQSSAPFAVARNAGEVAAPAQSASPATGNQTDRARVVEQITRHLETMRLTDAGGEMRLRLNPHNLGSVQVSIATHQDGVVARIAVESAQVQQAMEGAKEHLRAGLEARGLRVQSVEVTVMPNLPGDNSAAFSEQRNWQSANAQESAAWQANYGRRTAPQTEAAPAATAAIISPRVLSTSSRLDCRA